MESTISSAKPPWQESADLSAENPGKIPLYVFATVFSSLCINAGLIWDICWHISIGRDGLLSPPHLLIYMGAVVAGLFSGFEILRVTFWGKAFEKNVSVKIWGFFYSSLGALFCVWGALAMLTSAPFDDWWHNTYGLDVTILSPPHTVLALGIIGVQFGAMISVLSLRNRNKMVFQDPSKETKTRRKILFWCFSLSAGILLCMWYILLSEKMGPRSSHQSGYYIIAAVIFPLLMTSAGRAAKNKWAITAMTAAYTMLMLLALWIIPLFKAEPKLGPILNHIDHYQGFKFPLLLIVPAMVMDWLRDKYAYLKDWKLTVILSTGFLLSFFVTQWYFGAFLLESPYARNWFFGSHYLNFSRDPHWIYRYKFPVENIESTYQLAKGLAIALCCCLISTSTGLGWGKWMNKVKR